MLPALGLWFALQDAPMKLVLESSMTTGKHGEGAVARLRNAGDAPVTVLVDAHFHEVSCSLHDGTGAPVPAFDQRCLCGAGLPIYWNLSGERIVIQRDFIGHLDPFSAPSRLYFRFRASRQRSPVLARRSAALVSRKSSGWAPASSSHVSGIDTGAPGAPRGE